MKTEVLREFVTLCECRSMREAAKRLYISQPTLSAHISELELEIGHGKKVALVDRRNACTPTEAGYLLLHTARRVLSDLEEGIGYIDALVSTERNQIVRAAFPQASALLVNAMNHLKLPAFKFVDYDISQGYLSPLIDGVADVMSLFNLDRFQEVADEARERGFVYRQSHEVRMGLLLSKSNPLAEQDEVSFEDLRGVTFATVGPDHVQIAGRLNSSILGADLNFKHAYHSLGQTENLLRMDLGNEAMLVPADFAIRYLEDCSNFVLKKTVGGKPLYEQRCLVWSKDAPENVIEFARRFIEGHLVIDAW